MEWIEIREGCEMPNEGTDVLVRFVDDNRSIGGDLNVDFHVWNYFSGNHVWKMDTERQRVTHWMPLPAPPETT